MKAKLSESSNLFLWLQHLLSGTETNKSPGGPADAGADDHVENEAEEPGLSFAERVTLEAELNRHYRSYHRWAIVCWVGYYSCLYLSFTILAIFLLVLFLNRFRTVSYRTDLLLVLGVSIIFLLVTVLTARFDDRWRVHKQSLFDMDKLRVKLFVESVDTETIRNELTSIITAHDTNARGPNLRTPFP